MSKKTLKPGSLALGESNAKLNVWHGRYNGNIDDVFEEGFFKAYFRMLAAGDLIYLVIEDAELDALILLVSENSATEEDKTPRDEFIKVKLLSSTRNADIKALKAQIKSELVRQYGLKQGKENDQQDTNN